MNLNDRTELIITPENKIYHLNLKREEIADTIILVGDPARVEFVSNKFDKLIYKSKHREFITHTGVLNNKNISVISTGIGTDNIDIVVNELDALVNIDFKTKSINKNKKKLKIIRLGTSGTLQENIKIDSFIVSEYALGIDSLANFYENKNLIIEDITKQYIKHTKWPKELGTPYCVKASNYLLDKFKDLNKGITITTPGFYAPQGRELRLKPAIKNFHEKLRTFSYKKKQITNFEMEASALYFLGRNLGHETLTICAVLANRFTQEYSKNYTSTINQMIEVVLKRIC